MPRSLAQTADRGSYRLIMAPVPFRINTQLGLCLSVSVFPGPAPYRATPRRTVPSRAEPCRAEPSRAELSRAEPNRAEPSRAEPCRAVLSRAEPSRAEPNRAEPSRADPSGAVEALSDLGVPFFTQSPYLLHP